ncbi:MAG: PaaI family thioesterase [Candidatus Omnitrophica bacterium]|nr:PaaI family thioesterase [Candidatus Omnitrophota bacterium]MDD5351997.1 PaaI family thioesterase [Candidatus Omnitrophota bacterium]MDD5551051.1 PaaI family thioesterase [Candidatus Omnitrophota bacterium]
MDITHSPFENFLKMYVAEKGKDFCKIGLSHRKDLTNPHGIFHGGVIASIADTAAVQSLHILYPTGGPYFTVSLSITYKNPTSAKEIFAEARSRHLRSKFFKTDVTITDSDNKLIAQAEVKSFLPNYKQDK